MIYGAVTALMLLLATFWLGADWIGAKKYQNGFEAGKADERSRDEEKMKTLTARLEADGLAIQMKEAARAKEIQRIQQAASDAARAEYSEATQLAAADVARAIARVRDTDARDSLRRSDRDHGLSEAARAATRAAEDRADAARVLSARDREALVLLAARADRDSAALALCRAAFPVTNP